MNLRVVGTIGTFLLVFLGLTYKVGADDVEQVLVFLGFGSVAGLIAWFKLFKPRSQREGS
jgi:hypothetical protein